MLQGYEMKFNIYAESQQEVEEARAAIITFINTLAKNGYAVRGSKITEAMKQWDKNQFIKGKILEFFK
jgi:hypothetical protein